MTSPASISTQSPCGIPSTPGGERRRDFTLDISFSQSDRICLSDLPLATTMKSANVARPVRSMVTISSALPSSNTVVTASNKLEDADGVISFFSLTISFSFPDGIQLQPDRHLIFQDTPFCIRGEPPEYQFLTLAAALRIAVDDPQ